MTALDYEMLIAKVGEKIISEIITSHYLENNSMKELSKFYHVDLKIVKTVCQDPEERAKMSMIRQRLGLTPIKPYAKEKKHV